MDPNHEVVYYDSMNAKRTCIGYIFNADCCCGPVYKITSERVLYTEWDWWYLCDDPLGACCCPCIALRAVVEDFCCCGGGGGAERIAAAHMLKAEQRGVERGSCSSCCAVPVGRSLAFFDMDIVTDIGAHQRCSQLLLNEGDLQIYRTPGGDMDNSSIIFVVSGVPEVFNTFDELSYQLSLMDLSHYRQSAMGQRQAHAQHMQQQHVAMHTAAEA